MAGRTQGQELLTTHKNQGGSWWRKMEKKMEKMFFTCLFNGAIKSGYGSRSE